MTRYVVALIVVLAAFLIGCSAGNPSNVPGEALEAEPSEVLERAVRAMEDNPRFGIVAGYLDSEGEPYPAYGLDLKFVLPDRFSWRQQPGYEVIPFLTVIGQRTYVSPDGTHWEELGRDAGAEWAPVYFLRWNPYEFLNHAGNPEDGGTASVDGAQCRVIEVDLDTEAWGNGSPWTTEKTSVQLVVYADAASYLPRRVLVLWRQEYPQGVTELPYTIDISYDETIAIEAPEEVLTRDGLQEIADARNPVIEDCAWELVRILSAFEEANGVFPERLDPETVGDVMRDAGLGWPANPTTGAPMADDDPIPGNFFYLPMDNGSDYQLSVYMIDYNGGCVTYYGSPVGPLNIPRLTDEQKERALEIALADPRVQELLEDRPYDVGEIGPCHMRSRLLGAVVEIDLKEPCIIEYDWPYKGYQADGSLGEFTRHETAGVETLDIEVSLERERVMSIRPLSFRVFR